MTALAIFGWAILFVAAGLATFLWVILSLSATGFGAKDARLFVFIGGAATGFVWWVVYATAPFSITLNG